MTYKSIYEFLLWDNCNNNCKFCFQRKNPRLFNQNQRKKILDDTISFIKSDRFEKGSHVLICGGEIFDKPSDFSDLNVFFAQIDGLMADGTIDLLYLNTNLIYEDVSGLCFVLDMMKDKFDRLKFTTSYDLYGRFNKKFDETLFFMNLKWLKEHFPNCNVVVNTILTKQTCEKILNETLNPREFMNNYQCWVNFVPYIIYDESMSASKGEIFGALAKIDTICPNYLEQYIPNITIEQEKKLYYYQNGEYVYCSCELSDCGHAVNFKRYSKDGTCFCCDLKNVFAGKY